MRVQWRIPCGAHPGRTLVVAEAGAYGDLVAAFGAPAAENGCARLGLHAGKKPVCLRAMAAVGLEGTLRHSTRLLLKLFAVATVSEYTSKSLYTQLKCGRRSLPESVKSSPNRHPIMVQQASRIDLHK